MENRFCKKKNKFEFWLMNFHSLFMTIPLRRRLNLHAKKNTEKKYALVYLKFVLVI